MEVNVLNSCSGLASSNPAVLSYATERLKEEHQHLRSQLKLLEVNAKEVILIEDTEKGLHLLQHLRSQTAQLMNMLERHAKWEDEELFPFLMGYFHRESVPTIMPSFWVLEKDHQLGVSFIQSFNETVINLTPLVVKKQLVEAASHLVQACLILNDHFTMEEQLILPLTEKVLMDLESFFS
ncbi:hemerythrin domain-containing protein [Paenibacillus roseipurpureus]|uniref:Hemerythrin domain-containing protein n=1 Tax=Paenibacillus roseopurpureus TaxID=2918901 RepID=A0AA96RIC8_9BACL|nr:hemerythrin domain-containing protein [Paenibacillus sp. MBLB1832]WNR44223.1 hemerythrin domain-containing protein [Paenibacillus sp. MBLB1832]